MINPAYYWIVFVAMGALCATAAQQGAARGRPGRELLAWLGPVALLALLGYLDWDAETVKETTLTSYMVGAVLTPSAAVAAVWLLEGHSSRWVEWGAAAAAAFLAEIGVVFLAFITGF